MIIDSAVNIGFYVLTWVLPTPHSLFMLVFVIVIARKSPRFSHSL